MKKLILSLALFPAICYCSHTNIISELCFEIKQSNIASAQYSRYQAKYYYHVGFREGCMKAIDIIHALNKLDEDDDGS